LEAEADEVRLWVAYASWFIFELNAATEEEWEEEEESGKRTEPEELEWLSPVLLPELSVGGGEGRPVLLLRGSSSMGSGSSAEEGSDKSGN
jgi:hypothetical protein